MNSLTDLPPPGAGTEDEVEVVHAATRQETAEEHAGRTLAVIMLTITAAAANAVMQGTVLRGFGVEEIEGAVTTTGLTAAGATIRTGLTAEGAVIKTVMTAEGDFAAEMTVAAVEGLGWASGGAGS